MHSSSERVDSAGLGAKHVIHGEGSFEESEQTSRDIFLHPHGSNLLRRFMALYLSNKQVFLVESETDLESILVLECSKPKGSTRLGGSVLVS